MNAVDRRLRVLELVLSRYLPSATSTKGLLDEAEELLRWVEVREPYVQSQIARLKGDKASVG